jgi:hypothetical protein
MSEQLWCFPSWQSEPRAYEVIRRTDKTAVVQSKEHHLGAKHTVRATEIGGDKWFTSEREAWEGRKAQLERKIEYAKAELQRLRSALGQAEARLK